MEWKNRLFGGGSLPEEMLFWSDLPIVFTMDEEYKWIIGRVFSAGSC